MSIQIKKKFLGSQSIDGSKILFLNDEAFKALKADGTTEVSLFKVGSDDKLKFLQVPQLESDPTDDKDMARKGYVDTEVSAEESRAMAAEASLDAAITALSSSGGAAVSAVQSELDATQSGAGLSSAGAYTAPVGSNYLGSAVSLKDADSKLDAAIKAEVDARIADVDAEQTRAEAAEVALDGRLDSIEGIVTSTSLTLTGAGPAVITASDLEFAVSGTIDFGGKALNSVGDGVAADDAATKGQLDAEVSARIADVNAEESRAMAAESALDGRLDIVEGADTVEGSVAKAEKDAKDYADAQVSAEASARIAADSGLSGEISTERGRIDAILLAADANKDSFAEIVALINSVDTTNDSAFAAYVLSNDAALAQEISDRITDVNTEESRALAAESALDSRLDALEADPVTKAYVDAADFALDGRLDIIEGADTVEGSVAKAEKDAKDYADAQVSAEQGRALAAESALDSRLDVLEGDATTEGSVAKAEQDAKAYTDSAIAQEVIDRNSAISTAVSNLVDGAPALLDTLNELAAAINDDENFAVTIAGQISGLDSRADALEAASVEFKPVEKFVLTSTDISNGYITLSYKAIQHSLRVSVDRLAVHQGAGNDYTVSLVGGVTRITFVNSLVTAGQEKLSVGDEVYVEGAKLAIVTV